MSDTLNIDPRDALRRKSYIEVNDLGRSELDALYSGGDITQYVKITKLTIQKFIEACLSPDGQFRTLCKRFASFTGDFIINQNLEPDSRKRMLQIARYFEQVKERPPQIIIQDKGYHYEPASLGGLTAGWNERNREGQQIVRIYDSIPIPIEITCAAMDETTTEDLQSFLSFAFGSFQKFMCGYELKPSKAMAGAYWVVLLPAIHEMGARNNASFQGDPKTQIFAFTMTMEVRFENSTYITYNEAPLPELANVQMEVTVPSKITLGSVVPVMLGNTVYPIAVYSSDPRVAYIEQQHTTFFIKPQRVGKFKLIVAKPSGATDETMTVYAEKEMTVSLR